MDIVAIIIVILISIILVLTFYVIGLYNKLVDSKNRVEDRFNQIDIELTKKMDLIPSLVEIVKKHVKHEDKTLEEAITSKNKLEKTNTINGEITASNDLNRALNKIYALGEIYPELNKDKAFQTIRNNIDDIDNGINYARTFYNDAVLNYNNVRGEFPSNIIAKVFKFKDIDYLK